MAIRLYNDSSSTPSTSTSSKISLYSDEQRNAIDTRIKPIEQPPSQSLPQTPPAQPSFLQNIGNMVKGAAKATGNYLANETKYAIHNPSQVRKNVDQTLKSGNTYKSIGNATMAGIDTTTSAATNLFNKASDYLFSPAGGKEETERENAQNKANQEALMARANSQADTSMQKSLVIGANVVGQQLPFFLVPETGLAKGVDGLGGIALRTLAHGGENTALMAGLEAGNGASAKEILQNAPVNFTVGMLLHAGGEGSSILINKVGTKLADKSVRDLTDSEANVIIKAIADQKLEIPDEEAIKYNKTLEMNKNQGNPEPFTPSSVEPKSIEQTVPTRNETDITKKNISSIQNGDKIYDSTLGEFTVEEVGKMPVSTNGKLSLLPNVVIRDEAGNKLDVNIEDLVGFKKVTIGENKVPQTVFVSNPKEYIKLLPGDVAQPRPETRELNDSDFGIKTESNPIPTTVVVPKTTTTNGFKIPTDEASLTKQRNDATRTYQSIGMSDAMGAQKENAGLRILEDQHNTPQGQQIAQKELSDQIHTGNINPNSDGTITVYRGGTPYEGNKLTSVSTDRAAAEQFSNVQEFKVKPEDVAVSKGLDPNELLVKTDALSPLSNEAKIPTESNSTSKISQSVNQKAIEQKLTTGYSDLAGYDKQTIKEQSEMGANLSMNRDEMLSVIKGDKPLPDRMNPVSAIIAADEHINNTGDVEMSQALANSPLISETSKAAQIMRMAAEREPDSITAKFQEVRDARVKAKGGNEGIQKTVTKTHNELKTLTKSENIKGSTQWGKLLESIKCQ